MSSPSVFHFSLYYKGFLLAQNGPGLPMTVSMTSPHTVRTGQPLWEGPNPD